MNNVTSPQVLLPQCEAAQTLSVSDNHATILLRSKSHVDQQQQEGSNQHHRVKSLLKLTVIPTHKKELVTSQQQPQQQQQQQPRLTTLEELENAVTDEESQRILRFLGKLDFCLTSESGAEYSYYNATEKTWSRVSSLLASLFGASNKNKNNNDKNHHSIFQVELISPASDRQIQRSMPAPAFSLMQETPTMYETIVKPYIQSIVDDSGSLSWIQNVVECKKELERLLLATDDFVLNVDTKWRSHPDMHAVPRSEWYRHEACRDLYCLAIVKDETIRSLRDLRGDLHLSLLRSMYQQGRATIETVYGIAPDQIRVFVHYQPQFYHFHVHFTRLENEIGCQVERGHLLSDIIQNLEMNPNYYAQRTITYKLKTSSELYTLLLLRKEAAESTSHQDKVTAKHV